MIMSEDTPEHAAAIPMRPWILVIDDERSLRESMRIFLQSTYRVHTAACVDDGVAFLQRQKPAAVILDLSMPGKDGLQGLREIKPAFPNVPVLILTGYADDETHETALQLGAAGFMRKPFELVDMLSTIAELVESSKQLSGRETKPAALAS